MITRRDLAVNLQRATKLVSVELTNRLTPTAVSNDVNAIAAWAKQNAKSHTVRVVAFVKK